MLDRIVMWFLLFRTRPSDERGQDVLEYGLLGGGIAILLIVAVGVFSTAVGAWFERLADWFTSLEPLAPVTP